VRNKLKRKIDKLAEVVIIAGYLGLRVSWLWVEK
jgi:hypothetical protein